MTVTVPAKKSSLYDWHLSHRARLGEVGGFHAPICYKSFEAEYRAIRSGAALFDFATFGLLRIGGAPAREFLNRFTTMDLHDPQEGRAIETLLCTSEGSLVDRLLVVFQENQLIVVTSIGRAEEVVGEMADQAISEGVEIDYLNETSTVLGLVGPKAQETLAAALKMPAFSLEHHEILVSNIFTAKAILVATILCGEPAFLIITGLSYAPIVVERLLGSGQQVTPCGMAAFDTARIEAGEPAVMYEAAVPALPVELGLMDLVDRNKMRFTGRDAVIGSAQLGQGNWLMTCVMRDKVVPRAGAEILIDSTVIGRVTSGMYNPRLKNGVGLAVVDRAAAIAGSPVRLRIRNGEYQGEIAARPLYRSLAVGRGY